MPNPKRFLVAFVISALAVSLAGICLFLTLLPAWLENTLVPDMVEQMGIEAFSWDLRRVGITGADLAEIKIGDAVGGTIGIDTVQLNYSVLGLFRKHIDRVLVSGVTVNFQFENGKPILEGLGSITGLSESDKNAPNAAGPNKEMSPVTIGEIDVRNVIFQGTREGKKIRIPAAVHIIPESGHFQKVTANISLYFSGERITIEVKADLDKSELYLLCNAGDFNLESLPQWAIPASPRLSGVADFSAGARILTNSFEVSDIDIKLVLHEFMAKSGNLEIGNPGSQNSPIEITMQGKSPENLNVHASGLSIASPVILDLADLKASVQIDPGLVKTSMKFNTRLNSPMVNITPDIAHSWELAASLSQGKQWEFELATIPPDPANESSATVRFRIQKGDSDIRSAISKISLSGVGNLTNGEAKISGQISKVHLEAGSLTLDLPELHFETALDPKPAESEILPGATFSLRLPNVSARAVSERLTVQQILLDGKIEAPFSQEPISSGRLELTGASVADTLFSGAASGIQMAIPFAWPPKTPAQSGSFSIKSITHQKKAVAAIKGTIKQEGLGAALKATINNKLLPGLDMTLNGNIHQTPDGIEARIRYEIPQFQVGNDIDLGKILPSASGISFDGGIVAQGEFLHARGQNTASLAASLTGANLKIKESGIAGNGLRLDIDFPDLLALHSLPHQTLRFDFLELGNLKIEKGTVVFQIESPKHVFIEKSHFKWCGGNVDTNAALVSLPELDVELILFCDRLHLAGVLQQLGGVTGEGEGAVNGRIPIAYHDGEFKFDDGFLYSTPGQGGAIKLSGTDVLLSGIPAGTPEYTQIDLAREALKHYDYDWARVNVTTTDRILHLGLQLDGKPVDPLPFEYNTTLGGFARVEAGSPGSRFQGIRLDVNFNLPLEKVLKYGKGLKDLF